MKKATAILLSSVIFASLLCSCGKSADSSAVSSAVSTKTTSPTAAPTEAPTPEPTQQPAGQPASQLFSKVTGFSREWQDGKHVINGLDTSGNKICGIIDGGGNTVLMDGYTALYPLADGPGEPWSFPPPVLPGLFLMKTAMWFISRMNLWGMNGCIRSILISFCPSVPKRVLTGNQHPCAYWTRMVSFCMTAPIVPTILLISWTLMTMASYGLSPAV